MADLPSLLPFFPPPSSFLHPRKSRHERDEKEEEEEREFRPFYVRPSSYSVPHHTKQGTQSVEGGEMVYRHCKVLVPPSAINIKVEMKILLNISCATLSQTCIFPFSLLNFVLSSSLTLSCSGGGGPHLPFPPNQTPYFFGTSSPPFPYTYVYQRNNKNRKKLKNGSRTPSPSPLLTSDSDFPPHLPPK